MANQVGKWAFIIGLVLSIILGIGAGLGQTWANQPWLSALLVVAGLVVGFVNISIKEVQGFLLASLAVLIAGSANLDKLLPGVPQLGAILGGFVNMLLLVVAPAALIVALRAVYGYAAE